MNSFFSSLATLATENTLYTIFICTLSLCYGAMWFTNHRWFHVIDKKFGIVAFAIHLATLVAVLTWVIDTLAPGKPVGMVINFMYWVVMGVFVGAVFIFEYMSKIRKKYFIDKGNF